MTCHSITTPGCENKPGPHDNLRKMNAARQEFLRAFAEWVNSGIVDIDEVDEQARSTHSAMRQLGAILIDGRPL